MAIRPQNNGQLDVAGATFQVKYVRETKTKSDMKPYYNSNPVTAVLKPKGPDHVVGELDAVMETSLQGVMTSMEAHSGANPGDNPMTPSFRRIFDACNGAQFQKALQQVERDLKALYAGRPQLPIGVVGINFRVVVPFIANAYPRTLKDCSVVLTLPIVGPQGRTITLSIGGLK
tara:strand:- start:136 stop:657 length:522 start_codon:yes stop_codon:yes gene_type:complete